MAYIYDDSQTYTGEIVNFTSTDKAKITSVSVPLTYSQDLHGYENPWPAGGGKNKCYDSASNLYPRGDGLAIVENASLVTAYAKVPQNTDVVFSCATAPYRSIAYGFESVPAVGVIAHKLTYTVVSTTARKFNSGNYEYVGFYYGTTGHENTNIMFEVGSTATAYAPYSNICPISGRTGLNVYVSPTQDQQDATTYAVDWSTQAGTVYGGTVDVVTGVLTVDRVCVDGGDLPWVKFSSSSAEYRNFNATTPSVAKNDSSAYTVISSAYRAQTYDDVITAENYVTYIRPNGDTTQICVKDTSKASLSAAAFKTAMVGVQFCYELATPLTYQLTPQEVQMLLGENYVWSSSGDTVSVTYYAEGNANALQSLNILLGGNYSNPKTADDVSDKEALEIILGGNK